MVHVTGTMLEEMLQLPANLRAVLAVPVGTSGLRCCCLAFVFAVGQKVAKKEESVNHSTKRLYQLLASLFHISVLLKQ